MKAIGNILKSIYAVYAIVVVLVSFIILPCYFIIFTFYPKNKAPFVAHSLSRFWAGFLLTCFFIRTKVQGKELIDPKQTYIFVSNHRSQLDIPLWARACTNTFRFLSKIEVTRVPVFGYVVKRLYITVDRSDAHDRAKSLDKMKDSLLREKISVVLFPEGTRNRTDKPLGTFKDGAFRLAIEAQLPVAVLTILNTKDFTPSQKFQLKPGTIKAVWSEPIPTKGMTLTDVANLKEKVEKVMLEKLRG